MSKSSRSLVTAVLALTAIAVITSDSATAQPLKKLFRKGNANTEGSNQTDLKLSDKAGPWLITCTSFLGENAEHDAIEMCRVLQKELDMPVYYFRKDFDLTNKYEGLYYSANPPPEEKKNPDEIVKPARKATKMARQESFNEVAVLVGDFPSYDDAKCQKALEKIKYLKLETTEIYDKNRPLQGYRAVAKAYSNAVNENSNKREKGPFGSAFVMFNPMIPDDALPSNSIDSTILALNQSSNVEHSLLECPGKYSIRVATFKGASTFDLNEIEEAEKKFSFLQRNNKTISESKLAKASENARLLCAELRRLGVESYVFHDRLESYVCVGSYEWLTRENDLGMKEINPEIEKMIMIFKGSYEKLPNEKSVGFVSQTLPTLAAKGIGFDVQPVPVAVPKAPAQPEERTAKLPWSTKNR